MTMRINQWVKYFGVAGFSDFNIFDIGTSPKMLRSDLTGEVSKYILEVEEKDWLRFKNMCRDNDMTANYAIGKMVEAYNKTGALVTVLVNF